MKSFKLDLFASTHWIGVLLGWCAFIGLCSVVGFHLWIEATRDRGWYLVADPNPHHWTRSHFFTLIVGCGVGLAVGTTHIVARRFRKLA